MIEQMGLSAMSLSTLQTAYAKAIQLSLNEEFIQLLRDELIRRGAVAMTDQTESAPASLVLF